MYNIFGGNYKIIFREGEFIHRRDSIGNSNRELNSARRDVPEEIFGAVFHVF